ncbi:MAG: chitobiase/beta-hexosaminidase C-terminal domain-containing protein [Prevotella sp.]|nr:chitobiase/beta-hexosaminidase C-terminal domain-containing protein [Prevotella sp.]
MTGNDWNFANYYQQLIYIDLSRVGGITDVPASAFRDKMENLEEIELPDGITSIGNRAFSGCTSLKYIDCYALTPPQLGQTEVFLDVPEGLTVFVPEESVDLYKAAEGWKDFIILPLRSKICELEVNIPDGIYKNLSLEIVNVKSGQKYKYIITDRQVYTFPNLIRNSTYRVYVRTQSGKTLVETPNVLIDQEVVSIALDKIPSLSTATVKVMGGSGELTEGLAFSWYDANDNLLSETAKVAELARGEKVRCEVSFTDLSLLREYVWPEPVALEVAELGKAYELVCTLLPVEKKAFQFKVGTVDNVPSKTGKYTCWWEKVYSGDHHVTGNFTMDLPSTTAWQLEQGVEVTYTIEAEGFKKYNGTFKDEEVNANDILTVLLEPLENPVEGSVSFTYQTAALQGSTGEQLNYYPDMSNVTYGLVNVTRGERLNNFTAKNNLIVIEDGAYPGDEIELTAHSITGDFEDTKVKVTVDTDYRFKADLFITQHGGIDARFMVTDNLAVKALLFNAEGTLLKQALYANFNPKALDGTDANNLTFDNLVPGDYTLITMGDSKYFSSLFDLSRFSELGLAEGVDYVRSPIHVTDGTLAKVRVAVVPLFDETKFYYTGPTTQFAANKANVIQGNYLTLSARIDFPADVKSRVSEAELVFPLPANSNFVQGSLMVGKNIAGEQQFQYTDNRTWTENNDANGVLVREASGEHSLTVQLGNNYADGVKFCIVPMMRGNFSPTAYVRFKLDDQTILQPIGTTTFTVNDVTMWTPSLVSLPSIFVNGNAPAFSEITIYDGDWPVGYTQALADGYWQTEVDLWYPVNLSVHPLQAIITTKEGLELHTEQRLVEYNERSIQAKNVEMSFYNPLTNVGRTIYVNFDLEHTTVNQPSYMFASGVEFVFTANLTNNSPEVVDNCTVRVFTNNHEWIELPAQYIENLDRWVAHSKFDTQTMPIGVRVEVEANVSEEVDDEDLTQHTNYWNSIINSRSAVKANAPEEDNTFELSPIGDEQVGISGTYFQDVLSNIDLTKFAADTLVMPTQTVGDTIRIYLANDGSYIVTGDNKDGSVWGVNMGIQAGSRSQVRIDTDVNDQLKQAILRLSALNPYLAHLTDGYMIDLEITKWADLIELYNQGDPRFTKADYDKAVVLKAFYQAVRDNVPITLQLTHNVNTLLSYARYGIDDTNEWQALSDRFLPCNGLDDPQARGLNWTSLRYTRQHGLQYVFAVEQAAIAVQMLAGLLPVIEANIDKFVTLGPALIALYQDKIQKTTDFIMYFATLSYQQNKAASRNHMRWVKRMKNKLVNCNYDMTESNDKKWDFSLPYPIIEPIVDPSGYVYEGVSSNRLEGVTATAYYKHTYEDMYGDLQQEIVKWDAENYGQENPLLTDEKGMYQWDVPQGEWQVKFEKEGYQTAYSEWLPVPPPQLDVNIAMTQLAQPEVTRARAFEAATGVAAGVELTFSKYMRPELLTTENIVVKGIKDNVETLIEGLDITCPDQEAAIEGSDVTYAKKVYAATDQLSQYDEVWVIVNRRVESYAGIQMASTFQQKIDVEKRVTAISTDSLVNVGYTGHEVLHFGALPTEAAAGRQILVKSANDQMLTLTNEGITEILVTLDENGQAELQLNGTLFGTTALKFQMVNEDIDAQTIVNVVDPAMLTQVKAPVASRISGTSVYRGQTVTISCESEGATIYYTTDGTCPCEEATRKVYQGPIVISEPMTLKVMSVGFNGSESEIREYNYTILQSTVEIDLAEGWNWASHDLAAPVELTELLELASDVLTQKMTTTLDATAAVKLNAPAAAKKTFTGDRFNPQANSINLAEGWNWIGYPIASQLTLADAFAQLGVEENDVVTNLTGGYAIYSDGQWHGQLQTLTPGQGYLYRSVTDKSFVYNDVATAGTRVYNAQRRTVQAPWTVNPRQYPSMMCITAQLLINGQEAEPTDYLVAAFSGDECRGVAQVIDGLLYLPVYGDSEDDELTFTCLKADDGSEVNSDEPLLLNFKADALGTVKQPFPMNLGIVSGIKTITVDALNGDVYNTMGQKIDPSAARHGVYIVNGRKVQVK